MPAPKSNVPEATAVRELREKYLQLTRVLLPATARAKRWSVRQDHCFMRLILDHLFGDCWYRHLDRRQGAAVDQLSPEQLREGIELGLRLLHGGEPEVQAFNRRSLGWRGKLARGEMRP